MTQVPIIWPDTAYVPGRTPRPPDGLYDPIRDTAVPGMTPEELAQSAAMQHGYAYIEAGFYWEAHEVLEPVWMALPQGSAERDLVQGLIQTANGLLKLRMERPRAARRLHAIAQALMDGSLHKPIPAFQPERAHEALRRLEAGLDSAI